MRTERYFTFREFLSYMMQFDNKSIDRPPAPEFDLPIVKKMREEKARRKGGNKPSINT